MRIGVTARTAVGALFNQAVSTNADGTYLLNNQRVPATLTDGVPFPVTVNGQNGFLLLANNEVTFSVQQGVSDIWYVTPTPLIPQGLAYLDDAVTPLLGTGTSACFDFRVLALTADQGVDFLGNEYRSCVIQADGSGGATTTPTWTSPALPSQFAVVSQYFDVRPQPVVPGFEAINLIANPSFEWDSDLSQSPFGWSTDVTNATADLLEVQQEWASSGIQSLRSTSTISSIASYSAGVKYSGISALPNESFTASCMVNVLSLPPQSTLSLVLEWFTPTSVFISNYLTVAATTSTLGIQSLVLTGGTAPSNATSANLRVICSGLQEGIVDFLLDSVQLTQTAEALPYFDGDTIGSQWLSQRGQSPSALLEPLEPTDDTVVIDGVLLDPSTPNMAFNVYFSVDDSFTSDTMTEGNWESKLWQRVPDVFIATQAQQYVFPSPVAAKYMKVEFTNLQSQSYTPGTFAQPVSYKKFPTWVADFFIAQLELSSFVSQSVDVQYDALTFAYSYYLDDIGQSPATPVADPQDQVPNLTTYFSQSNAANQVDASTLAQINLVMNSFQLPTGSIVNTSTLLGQSVALSTASSNIPLTSEVPISAPPSYAVVSSSSREPVVFEQSLPVMYFFVTCRHAYKELTAPFDFNRAYYAGVNNIAFIRHDYSTSTDSSQYIESGNDSTNALRQDFDVDTDLAWYAY